jgi:hypothetical protein
MRLLAGLGAGVAFSNNIVHVIVIVLLTRDAKRWSYGPFTCYVDKRGLAENEWNKCMFASFVDDITPPRCIC